MNIKETREEILKRANVIRERQQRRLVRVMQGALAVLIIALVITVQFLPVSKMQGEMDGYYGTLTLGSELGAYIIVGIICFLIGVFITLLAIKTRENNKNKRKNTKED